MITYDNKVDDHGNPTGGSVEGVGLKIDWQSGTLGPDRSNKNGALIDEVIESVIQRLRFFQSVSDSKYACRENAITITKLEEALHWQWSRQRSRAERGVLGHNKP